MRVLYFKERLVDAASHSRREQTVRMDSLGKCRDRQFGRPAASDRRGGAANREAAVKQLEDVVRASTEHLGEYHPDTIAHNTLLANLRAAQAREGA